LDEVNSALQRVARGTGIVFFGGIIGILFTFVSKTLVARNFERAQYGTFNIALTLVNIGLIVALMGFLAGLPREISRYRRESPHVIRFLVSTALIVSLLVSSVIVVLYYLIAPWLSEILNDPYLGYTLRVVAISLPFMVISYLLVSVSRGFDRVRENVYYRKILPQLLYLLVVFIVVFGGFEFNLLFSGYVIVQVIIAFLLVRDLKRIGLLEFEFSIKKELAIELIVFSFPLMLTGILEYVMNWTDTLMLGYYFNSDIVGLYNAASPLARFIPVFLSSAGFLFVPIATAFYTEGKLAELKRIYMIITRWVFLPTFPIFLLLVVFPEATITGLFGARYSAAATALQILALGFMFHTFLGLNGMSLVVIGQPNKNLMGNIFAAASNVILNVLLIPLYGIEGAAVATTVSYIVANLFRSGWLYKETGIHPFGRSYVLQIGGAFAVVVAMRLLAPKGVGIITAVLLTLLASLVYFIIILLLGTVEREDIELLRAVAQKVGINLNRLLGLLEKFST